MPSPPTAMQNVLVGHDVSATSPYGAVVSLVAVAGDQVPPFQVTSWPPSPSNARQCVAVRQAGATRLPLPLPSTRFHGPHETASAGTTKLKRPALTAALSPCAVATVTLTAPTACFGVVTRSLVLDSTFSADPAAEPNTTLLTLLKFFPLTTIRVPPVS